MASCAHCNARILVGGHPSGGFLFCNDRCRRDFLLRRLARRIPKTVLQNHVRFLQESNCPRCGREGPVLFHKSSLALSLLVWSHTVEQERFSCATCGWWWQLRNCVVSLALGWWAFPQGPIITLVVLAQNLRRLWRMYHPSADSPQEMLAAVRRDLAEQICQRLLPRLSEEALKAALAGSAAEADGKVPAREAFARE